MTNCGSGQKPELVISHWSFVICHFFRQSKSVDFLHFVAHVVHQDVLAERARRREVSLSPAYLRDFSHERDQIVIPGQHEGVDEDVGAPALAYLFEGEPNHVGIQTESIAVDRSIW